MRIGKPLPRSTMPIGGAIRRSPRACASRCCRRRPGISCGRATAAICRSMRSRAFISATARASSGSTGLATPRSARWRSRYGLMVNYLYDLDYIEQNHEAYAQQQMVVAASAVSRLVHAPRPRGRAGFGIAPRVVAGRWSPCRYGRSSFRASCMDHRVTARSLSSGRPLRTVGAGPVMTECSYAHLCSAFSKPRSMSTTFERACPFYEQLLGLNSIYRDQRLCAYDVAGRGVLLLFLRGHSFETVHLARRHHPAA